MRGVRTDSQTGYAKSAGFPAATAVLALTLSGLPQHAAAQTAQPTAVGTAASQQEEGGTNLDPGRDGLPLLRRRLTDDSPRDPRTDIDTSGPNGTNTGFKPNAVNQGLYQPTLNPLQDRFGSGQRRTQMTPATASYRGLSATLKARAAPSRRSGFSTKRITQETTQVTTQSLQLTPVVQEAVSGVPLPITSTGSRVPLLATNPALGLLTPGFLLGTDLSRPIPTDPAYAPLGYKIGTFTVLPSFTQLVGYDSNPDQTTRQAAKGSAALRTEVGMDFKSDWSSASVDGSLRGAYLETPRNELASRPSADGYVNMRIDANKDLQINAQGRFIVDTQRTTNPNLLVAAATARPLIALYGATLGATQNFNRFSVSLNGSIDRSEFENVRLTDGTTIRQNDRNLNQYSLRLRTGYEVSPDLTPFVDVVADTRIYDFRTDSFGVQRDSNGIGLLAGATIGLGRTLTGEISAGAQHRTYADRSLRDINSPLLNATLVWNASPLTTFRFNAATGVTETTIPGSSGVITEVATLEVQHDLLRNLSILLGGSVLRNEYQNTTIRDNGFSATARLDYRFNRWLTLRGTYIYQQVNSTSAGSSFRDNTVLVGLRVNP